MMNNIIDETIWIEKFKGKTHGCYVYTYVTQIKMFVFGANRFGMTINKAEGQVIFVLNDQLQLF